MSVGGKTRPDTRLRVRTWPYCQRSVGTVCVYTHAETHRNTDGCLGNKIYLWNCGPAKGKTWLPLTSAVLLIIDKVSAEQDSYVWTGLWHNISTNRLKIAPHSWSTVWVLSARPLWGCTVLQKTSSLQHELQCSRGKCFLLRESKIQGNGQKDSKFRKTRLMNSSPNNKWAHEKTVCAWIQYCVLCCVINSFSTHLAEKLLTLLAVQHSAPRTRGLI